MLDLFEKKPKANGSAPKITWMLAACVSAVFLVAGCGGGGGGGGSLVDGGGSGDGGGNGGDNGGNGGGDDNGGGNAGSETPPIVYRVIQSHDGHPDPDDNAAMLAGFMAIKKNMELAKGAVEAEGIIYANTTAARKESMLYGDVAPASQPTLCSSASAKVQCLQGKANRDFFYAYGKPMMIELGMPEDKIFEIATQTYNFNATSLDQMTTAGQFTANTIEKAIKDSNEKTTYRVVTSNGGGHNPEAEAIQYLLNKGYTAEVLKKHYRMVQHSSWNWGSATEAAAQTIARDYTIRINDQNRYSGGQGGLVPLRASPVLTSEKFAYAWYLTMGNGLFSDGAPGVGVAYNFTVDPYIPNFAARRDCSDAGSHHFASNVEMMNEHWDKNAGYVSTSNITYGGYDLDQMLWQMVHPIARFETPLSLPSPGHDTTLKAVLTGSWGDSMHYTWSVAEASTVDGIPGGVFFSNSSSPETEVSFTRAGVYVIRLTAMDSQWVDSYTKTIVVQNNLLASQNGLTGYYFDNFGVDDNNVRHDFTAFKVSRVDPDINFSTTAWGNNPPDASMEPTTWSVRWVGKINVPANDSYSFRLTNQSNDGARIFINGKNVADTWRNHPGPGATGLGSFPNATSEPITLAAGMHDIVVETYNTVGTASAVLSWANSAAPTTYAVIPGSNLFTK